MEVGEFASWKETNWVHLHRHCRLIWLGTRTVVAISIHASFEKREDGPGMWVWHNDEHVFARGDWITGLGRTKEVRLNGECSFRGAYSEFSLLLDWTGCYYLRRALLRHQITALMSKFLRTRKTQTCSKPGLETPRAVPEMVDE